MKTCEVVDGGAFATIYRYCRTHKCEPEACPQEKSYNISPEYEHLKELINKSFTKYSLEDFQQIPLPSVLTTGEQEYRIVQDEKGQYQFELLNDSVEI